MQIENLTLIEFGGEGADVVVRPTDCCWGLFPPNLPDGGEEEQNSTVDRELIHTGTRRA